MATFFRASSPSCPRHCSRWARESMKYCLCSVRDGLSLSLGFISVISWGVAEIPQIITNYREKSTEGLSIAFLTTWMLGDLFNVFGCLMEPATLPTQFYTALLYTVTTAVLFAQAIYYGHIYPGLKNRKDQVVSHQKQMGAARKSDTGSNEGKIAERWRIGVDSPCGSPSSPIPFPRARRNNSAGRELYYTSARSLSSSHTPPAGSFLTQRMTPPTRHGSSLEEPLLRAQTSPLPASPPATKMMLCLVSVFMFIGTVSLPGLLDESRNMTSGERNRVFVVRGMRKLLQISSSSLGENHSGESGGIGMLMGWAMAATYMGGRLPQICLNMRRGNVEGLNPLMFLFALVGNSTYVASILVNSMEWSKIGPNLPWLVDAGGCVILDTLILLQFIYFQYRSGSNLDPEEKHESADAV
ncbi:PREDICTED: uncharacterized protein LOC104803245 [Tarenaya hassleriana]|uniref:uncharacterized protein LOC104803245 n=1 Tax=Tarenaya hassleriana TaxID=28532 RepID=UPI00053C2EF1|nr:PREDICTED: uncharacterized protein LOC104803245 [Tarenaya hassleriana]XP_010525451.1 PREDICTED: uncharacterized protein LOC104803245 [Tarenaya hassleriana]